MTSIKNNKKRDFSSSYSTTSKNSPNKCAQRVLLYYILLLLSSKPCKKNEENIYDCSFTVEQKISLFGFSIYCLGFYYTMYQLVLVFCFQCKYHMVCIDNIPSHFTIMQIIMCFCQCLRKPLMPTDPFYQNYTSQSPSIIVLLKYHSIDWYMLYNTI